MTNEELAVSIKEGHKEYIEQLWLNIERFIVQQVNRFIKKTESNEEFKDDLYQVSYFAMLEAIEAYDPATGYKFLTYMKYPLKNAFSETLGYRTKRDKHVL